MTVTEKYIGEMMTNLEMKLKDDLDFALSYFGFNANVGSGEIPNIVKNVNVYGHNITADDLMQMVIEMRR
jgi:hypothetical protein